MNWNSDNIIKYVMVDDDDGLNTSEKLGRLKEHSEFWLKVVH